MATTRTQTGSFLIQPKFRVNYGGDQAGGIETPDALRLLQQWNADGGDDPSFVGWLYGEITVSAGDILLAHATDPFGSMGDAVYSDGLDPAGAKLKLVYLRNTDDAESVAVATAATNGLDIFSAAGEGITLGPGCSFLWEDLTGDLIGALSSGSNDALTLTESGGAPVVVLLALYGT